MSKITPKEYSLKNGEKLVIRTAVADDAQALLEHARTILAEDLYNITTVDEFKMTAEKEREWIQGHFDNPAHIVLVAEVNGSLIGLLHFENSSRKRLSHEGTLYMSVRPESRRKGICTALLQSLIAWAKENPVIEKLTLTVFATNQPAISLYKKMGFVEEGRRVQGIKMEDGRYVDEILMSRFVKD